MPSWGAILAELGALDGTPLPTGQSPFDVVRRKYLAAVARATSRNVILYASNWTAPNVEPEQIAITMEDMQGFMEAVHGLPGNKLDLILHLPGGSATAADAIVKYLRAKFTDIRVFIPHAAMSAATMMACAADKIVMGKHSSMGPIDPQFILTTELGRKAVPAHAILEQFAQAQRECRDPALLPSWLPILRQYGPALIVECKLAQKLGTDLVAQWLETYMFAGRADAKTAAAELADRLSDHGSFKSHSRTISYDEAKALGLVVEELETNQGLQDAVLSAFHAASHTFNGTPAVKIVENHMGKAWVKRRPMFVQVAAAKPSPPQAPKP